MDGLIRPVDICLPESGGRVERRAGGHFISLQTTMAIDFLVTPRTEVTSSYIKFHYCSDLLYPCEL